MTLRAWVMLMKTSLWCCVEKTDGWKWAERWRRNRKDRQGGINVTQELSHFQRKCYSGVTLHLFLFNDLILFCDIFLPNPESIVDVFRVIYLWLNAHERGSSWIWFYLIRFDLILFYTISGAGFPEEIILLFGASGFADVYSTKRIFINHPISLRLSINGEVPLHLDYFNNT